MDRYLCMQAFVRVAESRSFHIAARQLGVSRSVVTHRVQQLEEFTRVSLLHRSTRQVGITDAGSLFFAECAELLARTDAVTEAMQRTNYAPAGMLRIQLESVLALGQLADILTRFADVHPKIELDVVVRDECISPVGSGFDVSLQLHRPRAGLLIEREICRIDRILTASPGYLAAHGIPMSPFDLANHALALPGLLGQRWSFQSSAGRVSIPLTSKVRSNSYSILHSFATVGSGIACIPRYVCESDLRSGHLTQVLGGFRMAHAALSAIYPTTHRGSLKVAIFIKYLRLHLAREPSQADTSPRAMAV